MPKSSAPSPTPKESPSKELLQFTPWIEDPDAPDYMTREDMAKMADAAAKYMGFAKSEKAADGLRQKFDPDEPRDEGGKWTDGGGGDGGGSGGGGDKPEGGGGKDHPGPGYSSGAYLKDGVIHTTSVYDAQRALHEDRKVELDQPRKVSTLIHRLGEEVKDMVAAGQKAPIFNLCNVSVAGTNLFCADTKGIPRIEMPQIAKKQTKDFIKYLKSQNYKIEKTKELASHLRATQDQIDGAKVAATVDKIKANDGDIGKRLVVSRDNYILDGHHHWAAKIGLDAMNNKLEDNTKIKIARVDISITKLLQEADKFTEGKGKKPVGMSALPAGEILARMIDEQLEAELKANVRAAVTYAMIGARARAKNPT